MSIERELLIKIKEDMKGLKFTPDFIDEIDRLLAQPEQEPVTNEPTATACARMPNGVCVSNVYDAYEEGRKSVMVGQEPVAWITEWVQRYRHNDTPIMDRAVSFTKGDAPAVPNPKYIPLYTAPPKREPIEDGELEVWYSQHTWSMDKQEYMWGFRDAEKCYGIGGGE